MKQKIFLLFSLFFLPNGAFMSESYFFHTLQKVAIEQQNNQLYIISRIFDRNGISLAGEKRQELGGSFTGAVKIVWQSNNYSILADKTRYFAVSNKSWSGEKENPVPLMSKSEIKKVIDDIFIFNSGKVEMFRYVQAEKAVYSRLKDFPDYCEILDKNTEGFLFRGKDNILLYNYSPDDKNQMTETVRSIALDPKTAVYCKNSDQSVPDFLYDNERFYTIENLRILDDRTEDFTRYNKYGGFLQWIYRSEGEFGELVFEEKANDALWVFLKNGLRLDNGKTMHFYALPATYASADQTLIEMNNRFFRSGYAAYEYRSARRSCMQETRDENELEKMEHRLAQKYAIDAGAVKNVSALRAFECFFTDGTLVYRVKYGNNTGKNFEIVKNLSLNGVYYPPITSYRNPTSGFFDDEGFIKFVSYENGTVEKIIEHTSELKSLGVAYLFDDKILIENEIIPSSLDFETAVLHESVVLNAPVVDELAEDTGFQPQKILYCHYFKDKNGLFVYKTGSKKLEKL